MHQDIGESGEQSARLYLLKKGYVWLASNFRTRWGEIDLIMEDGPTLVFVEVKRRQTALYGSPEEALTRTKKNHLEKAALIFLQQAGFQNRMVRFDVVAIDEDGLRHYPDAFEASGHYY